MTAGGLQLSSFFNSFKLEVVLVDKAIEYIRRRLKAILQAAVDVIIKVAAISIRR